MFNFAYKLNNLIFLVMVDNVLVTYGLDVNRGSLKKFTERFFEVASSYKVDCYLTINKNCVKACFLPFRYSGAKEIDEKTGAELMRSLIYLFENCFEDGVLWSVEMATALPF